MLSYKMIKRKFKLNDTNFAEFFGYKNRLAFFTSNTKDLLVSYVEHVYDRYSTGGENEAEHCIIDLIWPQTVSAKRKKDYKAGLVEFVDVVDSQTKKGKIVDPELGPRVNMRKYTQKKY